MGQRDDTAYIVGRGHFDSKITNTVHLFGDKSMSLDHFDELYNLTIKYMK